MQSGLEYAGLGLRGLLHRLDLLLHGLESGSEHGGGQLGYVLATQIAKGENGHKVSSQTLFYGIERALKQALKAGENCVCVLSDAETE